MRKFKFPPRDWLVVLSVVILVYLFLQKILPQISTGFFAVYIIRPATWGLLAYYILRLPKYGSVLKPRYRSLLIKIALGVAAFQIYFSVIAGFLDKFGKNPCSLTLTMILLNFIFASSSLAGMELSRAWLINRLTRKPCTFIPFSTALFYTYLGLNTSKMPNLHSSLEMVTKFFGSDFLPLFMENLLASFFALWGGPIPALAYRGVIEAFNWFCPILPDLNWAMKAFTGTVVPVLGLVITQQLLKLNPARGKRESGEGLVSITVLSVLAVIAIWFSVGVFPVRPTVIISGSMRPTIEIGDVAIIAELNPKLLKVGDIIQFRTEERPIPTVHRIIETRTGKKTAIFITQGDANNAPDDPVRPQQVVGKVIFIVPKVGWATIAVRELFS